MLKKTLLGLSLLTTLSAQAAWVGPTATNPQTTIKQLQETGKHDQNVLLSGKIIKKLDHERYEFNDGTGTITLKIDDKRWPAGMHVDQNTKVELSGEYDKEFLGTTKVEVRTIKVVP